MDYKDLGNRVRTVRRQQSLTQEQLAEKVGISSSFLGPCLGGGGLGSIQLLPVL